MKDGRTPQEKRDHQHAEIASRLWSGVVVLADVVDEVIRLVRENEERWLASIREQREPAAEKRREAERLAHEADVEEFGLAMKADWLKKVADDGPFGRAPYPQPTPRPKQIGQRTIDAMFSRPWHKQDEEPMEPWMASEANQAALAAPLPDPTDLPEGELEDDELPKGDPTGVVSELA